jgi:rhamnose utilization protein RhaD (predicted bifunctional aldolase and dehydrogenase)/NAD(P)-dependent dehydrogenase (short-subunit alcohol dehydrogenase family)
MRDRWSEAGARSAVERHGERWGEALALRTYSSRLIGAEPDLVLHGGGNTSVKDLYQDVLGDELPALYVKGSGWDLASIEPEGFTPMELGYLKRMRALARLSDEDMVDAQRTHRLRSDAPDPSIETLLHAFLPARFVDHSHADAILGLTNRRDGAKHVQDALGDKVVIVPYVKAGFDLAKVAADWFDDAPGCVGMVLLHHGLFTWGETAEQSYHRHIELVSAAERYLDARSRSAPLMPRPVPPDRVAAVASSLRGALHAADPQRRRWLVSYRSTPLAQDPTLAELAACGPLTPDHVIRTKPRPLVVRPTDDLTRAFEGYAEGYNRYFESCAGDSSSQYVRLDPLPRVIWVSEVGLFTVGASAREAAIAADIAEHTIGLVRRAQGTGPVAPLSDEQLFEMEYWSLEQKKLGKGKEPLLGRRVALVTGGAGAIGVGIARQLLLEGAHVVLGDVNEGALARATSELGSHAGRLLAVPMDVTDATSVAAAFDAAACAFGGVDLVVPNAGIAVQGEIASLDDEEVWRATEVNFMGVWRTVREAARRFALERAGGDIVVISTKNVAAPGASFGAYSSTKAAAHQLARVAALELAPLGVRVNLVTPDAVFSEGSVRSGLWEAVGPGRAAARGLETSALPAFYRERNLLKTEVTGSHVGRAVVFLASGQVPTTGAVLPVDGGLPEAFPR